MQLEEREGGAQYGALWAIRGQSEGNPRAVRGQSEISPRSVRVQSECNPSAIRVQSECNQRPDLMQLEELGEAAEGGALKRPHARTQLVDGVMALGTLAA